MIPRVVVTGLGVVSSAGTEAAAFRAAVSEGRVCLVPVRDPRYRPALRIMAGLIPALPSGTPRVPDSWPVLDRFVDLALAAADQALRQSGLAPASLADRMGAVAGTCSGPTSAIEAHYQAVLRGAPDRSEAQAFRTAYGSAVRALARVFGIGGFTGTVTTACSAGLTAIGMGADLIRSGTSDAVLAGGADAYHISTQIGFDGLKAPCDGPSAPFSKPTGLCLGEGAAFLVLERLDAARERGAPILAEVLGFGTSNDAHHCSSPDPSGQGQSLAVLRALDDAGVTREHVAYVNAHGTGTVANDKAETKAIHRIFGPVAGHLSVSSQKAVFGHTLGAAGALETAATLLCQGAGVLPPTANFSTARDGCDLDYVPASGRPWARGRPWVKESFAFGGHNAGLVFGPAPAAESPGPAARGDLARVCVAGIGLVTAEGAGTEAFRRALLRAAPVLRECAAPGHVPVQAALVPDALDPALERRLGLRRMDKAGAMATVAAWLAMNDAGIPLRPEVTTHGGLFLGHASASNAAEASFIPDLLTHDYVLQSVAEFPFVVPNATAGTVCRALALRGHHAAFCFGAGAGLLTLIAGASAVENRHAPFLLVGAVDALEHRGWGDWLFPGAHPPAEGAAFLLLEAEDHLLARGGRALARVVGSAVSMAPGGDWNAAPAADRIRSTAERALGRAGLDVGGLGAVCGAAGRDVAAGLPLHDTTGRLGHAEGCGPLFDLAAGLLAGAGLDRPLLGVLSSRQGVTASVVLAPF